MQSTICWYYRFDLSKVINFKAFVDIFAIIGASKAGEENTGKSAFTCGIVPNDLGANISMASREKVVKFRPFHSYLIEIIYFV